MSDTLKLTPEALVEALIFASPRAVPVEDLGNATGLTIEETEAALANLEEDLKTRGLRLQRNRNRVQLVSAPEAAACIETLLGLDVQLRFTQAAMETLSIVAYAQPVTRPQVESIRGVSSDSTLRTLLSAGMIEERGRAETLGRPILYGTTFEFLQQFGLQRLDELPPLASKTTADVETEGEAPESPI
ncbi:MAG: SMC-Scp complex subunit ScpB [Anaerolineae bacterium]|nr:SMC-Scp complex subunit ScpB [Anaerolineae bacterium]